jgi:hypothetical protein
MLGVHGHIIGQRKFNSVSNMDRHAVSCELVVRNVDALRYPKAQEM